MTFNQIHINGQLYQIDSPIDTISFCEDKTTNNQISEFLCEWTSEKETITVQTSGSTGIPKQLEISKSSCIESAKNTINYLDVKPFDTALLCLPIKYIGGKMMLIRAMVGNYNLVITPPQKNPLRNVKQSIDFLAITPYQAQAIISESPDKLKVIKNVIIGGGAVSNSFVEKIKDFPNNIYSTFGMTETVSHIALKKLNGSNANDFYKAIPPYKVSANKQQCLVIDCPTIRKEQIVTNDIVEVKDNQFKWLGRKDNIINTGGIKVSPETIETALSPIIKSRNILVAGIEDVALGEKIILLIEGEKLDIDLTQIKQISHLDKYLFPKEMFYLHKFAYTENGKINRIETIRLLKSNHGAKEN